MVPVGEMEGFCKSVDYHGPAWVQQVIQKSCSKRRIEGWSRIRQTNLGIKMIGNVLSFWNLRFAQ